MFFKGIRDSLTRRLIAFGGWRLRRSFGCAILCLFAIAPVNISASEQKNNGLEYDLIASPERCVALHRGQTCYQKIKLSWRTQSLGNYCIQIRGSEERLKCWSETNQASLAVVFESAKNIIYQLVRSETNQLLAETEIKVAWVYKTNRRKNASWRLF